VYCLCIVYFYNLAQLLAMGLDYFDLYMIHSPQYPPLQAETWRALELLYEQVVCVLCIIFIMISYFSIVVCIYIDFFKCRDS
jgi:hypothetical protein